MHDIFGPFLTFIGSHTAFLPMYCSQAKTNSGQVSHASVGNIKSALLTVTRYREARDRLIGMEEQCI